MNKNDLYELLADNHIILTPDSYDIITKDTYKHFDVSDKVVCFYNGRDWHVILLDDMLAYPILYFQFWSAKDNTEYINSLVVCPITLRSMIYKGKITIIDVIDDKLQLYNTDTNDSFFIDSPYTGSYDLEGKEKGIKSQVKRHEVKISTFRDIFSFLIDPKFIIVKEKNKTIIRQDYYTNKLTYDDKQIQTSFHPKTVVYMIQYFSYNMNKYKYTVIVGKDINKENSSGYVLKYSGVWNFINNHHQEFVKKKAYIYPIFWFMIEKMYEDVQFIYIE